VRLLKSLKMQVIVMGVLLLVTLGTPLLVKQLRVNNPRAQVVTRLEPIGWGILASTPLVLSGLTFWQWRTIQRNQARFHARLAEEGVTYLLLPRPDAPPTRAEKVSLWQRLSYAFPKEEHISVELSGWGEGQAFSLRSSSEKACHALITQLMTEYPGVEVKQVTTTQDDPLCTPADNVTVWREVGPAHRDQPLLIATPDPQIAVLGELALLPEGVRAGVQVVARADFNTRKRLLHKAASATSKKPETGKDALRPSNAARREVSYVDERAQHHFVETQVFVWASASYEGLAWQTVNLLTDTLRAQYAPHNPLQKGKEGIGSRYGREMAPFAGRGWTTQELGTLAHLVGGDTAALAPRLLRARSRALPASPQTYIPRHAMIAPFLRQAQRQQAQAGTVGDEMVILAVDEEAEDVRENPSDPAAQCIGVKGIGVSPLHYIEPRIQERSEKPI
jgi:hypothetical protein